MRILSNLLLKLIGWKVVGSLPDKKKYIIIVAPHTSNWDMVIGLIARFSIGAKISFLAKKQIFKFPFVHILRLIGGIPVDRSKVSNLVDQIVAHFNQVETLHLAITPEGTRKPVTRWKEGFYHIAVKAELPLVMIGFDYHCKEIKITKPFTPSGDMVKDFSHIVRYFRTIKGRYPKEIPDYRPRG